MILIQSVINDASTNDVIKWLIHFNAAFIRINSKTQVKIDTFDYSSEKQTIKLLLNNEVIDFDNITSYWYRRGDLTFDNLINKNLPSDIITYLRKEYKVLEKFLYNRLENNFHINKRSDNETNKLLNLEIANKCELNIPKFKIVNKYNNLKNSSYITKPFYASSFYIKTDFGVSGPTARLTNSYNESSPSFIQVEINKLFEIRTFYIHGEFYSIAIFSQNNVQTKVDFRNYDKKCPNRTIPFKLPNEIKIKINDFMNRINVNCGSIDLIYGTDRKYYFLEVNPIGQFQQVSIPGNYYLEKIIAKKLIKNEE